MTQYNGLQGKLRKFWDGLYLDEVNVFRELACALLGFILAYYVVTAVLAMF